MDIKSVLLSEGFTQSSRNDRFTDISVCAIDLEGLQLRPQCGRYALHDFRSSYLSELAASMSVRKLCYMQQGV
jgi:hypothetical protein